MAVHILTQTHHQTTRDLEDFGLEQQLGEFWDIFLDRGIMLDIIVNQITLDLVLLAGVTVALGLDGEPVHLEGQALHHPALIQGQPQVYIRLLWILDLNFSTTTNKYCHRNNKQPVPAIKIYTFQCLYYFFNGCSDNALNRLSYGA